MKALVLALAIGAGASAPQDETTAVLLAREKAYARALIDRDVGFLAGYFADDWRGGDWLGFITKSIMLDLVRSRVYTVKSMRLHDVRVRVAGNWAIVQGFEDEVSTANGQDASGSWSWTDVFEKRSGQWVVIASQSSRMDRRGKPGAAP